MSKENQLVNIDPRCGNSQIDQILVILNNMSDQNSKKWIDSVSIEKEALEKYDLKLHWRTIDYIIKGNQGLITRKKINKRWAYKVLENGKMLIKDEKKILLIEPSNSIQSMVNLHKYLSNLAGNIYVCDPYIDHVSLDILSSCPNSSSLSILTRNVKVDGKFKSLFPAFANEGYKIEIRITPQSVIHDRYIIDSTRMVILGTSLNGVGKKQSFIIEVGADIKEITLNRFSELWQKSMKLQI